MFLDSRSENFTILLVHLNDVNVYLLALIECSGCLQVLLYFVHFPPNILNEFADNENGCRFIKMNEFSR